MWNLRTKNEGVLEEALKFYDKYNIVTKNDEVYKPKLKGHISVKEAVFPFNKLPGADLILGPEMKSTTNNKNTEPILNSVPKI
jgi:carbamoyl-phosphate synthase large subunit